MSPVTDSEGRDLAPTRRRRLVPGVGVLVVVALGVAWGPRPTFDERWSEPALPPEAEPVTALSRYLEAREAEVPELRPGDEREIVWADAETPATTPVALVYIHGFSADRHEIEPVVSRLGEELGANVYFARLTGHGRDGPAMAEAIAADWLVDTAEAVAVGGRIGERVVLVGTSTGGTLATWAATRPEASGRIDAVILVSPNFQLQAGSSRILLYPWGGRLARLMVGPERCFEPENAEQERHWTTCYPTSALSPMMALVEAVRTTSLDSVMVPFLLVYSPGDQVVDARETERVLGTLPAGLLRVHVVEEPGDPERHVVAGDILSPSTTGEVWRAMASFITRVAASP